MCCNPGSGGARGRSASVDCVEGLAWANACAQTISLDGIGDDVFHIPEAVAVILGARFDLGAGVVGL